MAKKKTAEKKSAKDKLAAGAKEIKALEAKGKEGSTQAIESEPVVIPELTRPIQEVINDRVTIAPNSIGLTMSDDTTIEESLAVLDWTTSLSDHVGFMIGDVLNHGHVQFGDKYTAALKQTGRALSTLKGYSEASRRIPIEKRVQALSFSHHRELLRLPDEKTMDKVLKDLEKIADRKDGEIPTRDQLRFKVNQLAPADKKTRVTSGKRGKKTRKKEPELPPYEPTQAEQELMDEASMAIEETAKLLKPDNKLFKALVQMDTKTKQEWLGMLDPIVLWYKALDIRTGSYK